MPQPSQSLRGAGAAWRQGDPASSEKARRRGSARGGVRGEGDWGRGGLQPLERRGAEGAGMAGGARWLAGGAASASEGVRAAFEEFCQIVRGGTLWTAEATRERLRELRGDASAHGLTGSRAFPGLAALLVKHRETVARNSRFFTCLYRYAFFILREIPEKNLMLPVAEKAWGLLLEGRFPLLPQWLSFVRECGRVAITDDTWTQVLEFTRQVRSDLSDFDPLGAWPVLIDDFVEHLCARQRDHPGMAHGAPGFVADFPHQAGSKRSSRDLVLDLARQVGQLDTDEGTSEADERGERKRVRICEQRE